MFTAQSQYPCTQINYYVCRNRVADTHTHTHAHTSQGHETAFNIIVVTYTDPMMNYRRVVVVDYASEENK